ncbi:MAG TPA: PhoH family protein [Halanaerobiales bacterium]|nr:PhoH family protein [Halanaerobiales bacterium]HPZ62939.1 PhoH family protein [Halanaerobiales bacterium]HQD04156.1 PhoH family protein [Halanaerobiales bacterium]
MAGIEKELIVENYQAVRNFLGHKDENIKIIEEEMGIDLLVRGNIIKIKGEKEAVKETENIISKLLGISLEEKSLGKQEVKYIVGLLKKNPLMNLHDLYNEILQVNYRGKKIRPKTLGQKVYIDAIKRSSIVFAIGPAGTGKTYLAMVMAVKALLNKDVTRIILTRPAIEAGEKLGFLPGDLQEKVDPYLRPLYDALYDILGPEKVSTYLSKDIIEVAPLAYMRGRTLDNSFVILDEAQNTTPEQMKMFLTRMGLNSQAVITGDITQIDLPDNKISGLNLVQAILKDIEGIEFIYLSKEDVVRHKLVKDIIKAYERYEGRN